MKSSDKPEISKKWWTKEKPSEIKGTDLEKALAACESALADVKKKENEDTIAAALKSLEELSGAVDDTTKECEKKKLKDVATVLGKFDKLISDKTKELEKSQAAGAKESEGEEEDEEEGKTVFKEEYVARMIKMLRGGETLQFALGLNKQVPANSRLVLCNKRKCERLFKMLKQRGEFAPNLMTFGSASGEGKILSLTLADNAKEPSTIVKTAKVYFKGHKDLKYRKIRVIAGGETFEEDMPEDESQPVASASGDNTNTGDLQARTHKAEAADKEWQKARASISDQIAQVQRELDAFQDPDAIAVHDGLSSLVDTLPDPGLSQLAGSQDAGSYTSNLEKTRGRLQELQKLVAQGGALQAVDANPFHKTDIVGTVNNVLSSITKELQIA